ncbi:hypothetical protein [Streptomyces sp. NRRL S-244]|uniref:hypothetical protein n=1 Tax=Streptomyces sp. NRRL S-244 TaxID=1463897 RepID=UPI00068A34C6|nr:hypothetical protein [Streptomyces sp. NRRL S-244]
MTDEAEDALEAALEPHEPAAAEIEARRRVRDRATGMAHHEAQAALEAVLADAGDLESADAAVRAEAAEWQRITGLLLDHGGPYAPDTDAYVQGQLTARDLHRDRRRPPAPSPPAG